MRASRGVNETVGVESPRTTLGPYETSRNVTTAGPVWTCPNDLSLSRGMRCLPSYLTCGEVPPDLHTCQPTGGEWLSDDTTRTSHQPGARCPVRTCYEEEVGPFTEGRDDQTDQDRPRWHRTQWGPRKGGVHVGSPGAPEVIRRKGRRRLPSMTGPLTPPSGRD